MPAEPTPVLLLKLITGFWISQAIYAAVTLGLVDALRHGPRDAADLATAAESDPAATYRLLRALASCGIVSEQPDRRFRLTEMGDRLRADRQDGFQALVLAVGGAPYRAWGDLAHSVRTGASSFERVFGMDWFAYLDSHPEIAAAFDRAMDLQAPVAHGAIVDAYDFSRSRQVLDIGGGSGTLLERILRAHPHVTGVLFDTPRVIARATERWAASDLASRCRLHAGNFLDAVPAGADVHVLATVLHNWDDDRCLTILENCRRSLEPRGRVLISEHLIPAGNAPFFGKLLDLDMLVCLGGKERSEAECIRLLQRAGLRHEATRPAGGAASTLSLLVAGHAN